jgi:hypothetical protein
MKWKPVYINHTKIGRWKLFYDALFMDYYYRQNVIFFSCLLAVQFPSAISSQFQNILSANQEDVHICGTCKQNFSDINLFVAHKHAGCIRNTQKPSGAAPALLGHSTLDYLSTAPSSGGEDSTSPSPLGRPVFQVIVGGSDLPVHSEPGNSRHTLSCRGNGDSQILRSRLLGIQNDQQVSIQQQNITSNSGGMQAILMQQQSRREFQIDEEAVAAILANQLASEGVTSTHTNMSHARTGLLLILFSYYISFTMV